MSRFVAISNCFIIGSTKKRDIFRVFTVGRFHHRFSNVGHDFCENDCPYEHAKCSDPVESCERILKVKNREQKRRKLPQSHHKGDRQRWTFGGENVD